MVPTWRGPPKASRARAAGDSWAGGHVHVGRATHPNSTKTEAPALGTFPDLAAHALGRDVHLCPSSRPLTSRET